MLYTAKKAYQNVHEVILTSLQYGIVNCISIRFIATAVRSFTSVALRQKPARLN